MESQLSYLNNEERLNVYTDITNGCAHIWSKGKLQQDRLQNVLGNLMRLADDDPYFLAHLTSYAIQKLDSKDLKVLTTFANSLSDADGTPFIIEQDEKGRSVYSDKYTKPNLRIVSQAAVQHLDPKLVKRLIEVANIKQSLGPRYKEGTHFSTSLKTAIRKYIRFRENNPKAMEGIKKAGFAPTIKNIYRALHLKPSQETAEILGWRQGSKRKGNIEIMQKRELLDFRGMPEIRIANKIREEKIPVLGAISALPDKISPVIAVALLEQCSGDQAVILRGLFDSQGLLKDKEVLALFEQKISEAKTALDRVDKINTAIDKDVADTLKRSRAKKRKKDVGDIGKVFIHIDISSSMHETIRFAKERGAIIAECIENPEENFHWGAFNDNGYILKPPKTFEKDAFMAALYGLRPGGMTDCLACYEKARELGCEIDIYLTDQGHNGMSIQRRLQRLDAKRIPKPKASVIVDFSGGLDHTLQEELEASGIPVAVVQPETLTESALVSQAIRSAMVGATALIDGIMETKLLKLPDWWSTIK